MDAQTGYNCAIFRNESKRLSSDIILEAERHAVDKWGVNRAYTYVDPKRICSVNPGCCFKWAFWSLYGITQSGKHILSKDLR